MRRERRAAAAAQLRQPHFPLTRSALCAKHTLGRESESDAGAEDDPRPWVARCSSPPSVWLGAGRRHTLMMECGGSGD